MDENAVREHAEAHGRAIETGDLRRAGSDVAEEFQPRLPEVMREMPRRVTSAEVVRVEPADGDEYFAHIRYAGDDKEVTLQSRWAERNGRPMIVDINVVGV